MIISNKPFLPPFGKPFINPSGDQGAHILFQIRLEVDLSEFDSTVVNVDKLVQNATSALNGSDGGMEVLLDDTVTIYGEKLFTWDTDNLRFRIYFDPNGASAQAAQTDFLGIIGFNNSGGASRAGVRFFMDDAGLYRVEGEVRDDSTTARTTAATITDAPHYIEVHICRASSAVASDGFISLYVDGVLHNTNSGLDIFDVDRPVNIQVGAGVSGSSIDAGDIGSIYIDEIILNTTGLLIGA